MSLQNVAPPQRALDLNQQQLSIGPRTQLAARPVIQPPQTISRRRTPEQRSAMFGSMADALAINAERPPPLSIGEALVRGAESFVNTRASYDRRELEEQEQLRGRTREEQRRAALVNAVASYDPSQPAQMQNDAMIRALSGGAPEEALQLAQTGISTGMEREGRRSDFLFEQDEGDRRAPQRGRLENDLAVDRARRLAPIQAQANAVAQRAAPAGYRYTQGGNLEAIPGGPADIRATAAGQAQAGRLQASATSLANAIQVLTNAEGLVSDRTAGVWANRTREWGINQEATDLHEALEPVRAILSFENLAEMRRNSETGGALGSIAVRELDLLGSTIRSLNTAQGPAALRQAIIDTRTQLQRTMAAVVAAQREANGTAGQSQPGQPAQPNQSRPDPLGIR